MICIRRAWIVFALPALTVLFGMPTGSFAAPRVEARKVLDTATLGDPLAFDVGPGGAVLFLTRDNVFEAGSGKSLFGEPLVNPAWLGFAGGKLQLISGGALFVVDGGKPRQLIEVPLEKSVFASEGERTFISGVTSSGKPVLYIYKEGSGHKPLLELDAPIDAMALAQGALYFSAGSRIYTLREGGPARLLAHLPGFSHIRSLAVDGRDGVLYFSDGDHLYAVRGKDFGIVRRGVGGMLRWRDGSLYILSARDHVLLRMDGLPEALASAGTLVPPEDPCRPPVLSLYCEAEEKRAFFKAFATLEGSLEPGDVASRNDLAAGMAEQKKEFERIRAGLGKEAVSGAQAALWGGGLEPKTIRAGFLIATEEKGVGISLWDGSGIRIGPDSKAVLDACGPSGECRLTLGNGLLYFEPYVPPVEGMPPPANRDYEVAIEAVRLRFGAARFAAFVSGGTATVAVLDGRVKAVTREGETVIVSSGETFEVKRGEHPGNPVPADLDRLNKWWEEIR
ncbi:MAG TPA: hypothetical protein VGK27_10305 [Candidatus Deferrimicrobiaceae bacterium]|jgi:hypothetical protein